jgi:hypothetical protein
MIEAIKEVLKGIDQTELESTDGWWETSAGAEFGAKKLKYILGLLAQPEQEPVATLDDLEQEIYENTRQFVSRDVMEWMLKRYYTTPPQRKPLTDEMIVAGGKALAKRHADSCGLDFDDVWKYYAGEHKDDAKAAIEAAHGIKE